MKFRNPIKRFAAWILRHEIAEMQRSADHVVSALWTEIDRRDGLYGEGFVEGMDGDIEIGRAERDDIIGDAREAEAKRLLEASGYAFTPSDRLQEKP